MSDKCWSFVVDFPINILDSFINTHKLFKNKTENILCLEKPNSNICHKYFPEEFIQESERIEIWYFKDRGFEADLSCHNVKSMESIIRLKCINQWILF